MIVSTIIIGRTVLWIRQQGNIRLLIPWAREVRRAAVTGVGPREGFPRLLQWKSGPTPTPDRDQCEAEHDDRRRCPLAPGETEAAGVRPQEVEAEATGTVEDAEEQRPLTSPKACSSKKDQDGGHGRGDEKVVAGCEMNHLPRRAR